MFKKDLILVGLFFGLALSIASAAFAQDPVFPPHTPVPGGVAIISLDELKNNTSLPKVTFQGNQVMVLKRRDIWYAVVGIPLDQAPGETEITVQNSHPLIHYTFTVKPKTYRTETITLKDKQKVTPNKKNRKRIHREFRKTQAFYKTWSKVIPTTFKLPLPTSGRESSSFGVRRILNGILKNPHSGMDIAALVGTPVLAPASGRVIGVGYYFYSGRVVFIDHGMGFISNYAHLHKISVKAGQTIAAGQKIGTVGKTGRATGAHLHWAISLNNARVDPALFLEN